MRLEQLTAQLDEEERRGIARAARRLGGTRVDEELGVEPSLRAAVEAALGDLARAYVLDRDRATELGGERGSVVVRERLAAAGEPAGRDAAGARARPRTPPRPWAAGGSPRRCVATRMA